MPGRERAVRLGGDGTPRVAEFSVMELGALQGLGVVAARILLADALNLRHRHPVLWRLVCEAKVWGWAARKVARRCAAVDLSLEQARWVDGFDVDGEGQKVGRRNAQANHNCAQPGVLALKQPQYERKQQNTGHGCLNFIRVHVDIAGD